LTDGTKTKLPESLKLSEDEISKRMKEFYNLDNIPTCDVNEEPPKNWSEPFVTKAKDMYKGSFQSILSLRNYLQKEVDADVDLFILSSRYGWLHEEDVIYYYKCQLSERSSKTTRTAGEISDRILDGFMNAIKAKEYDAIVISLGTRYFNTLFQKDTNFLSIIEKVYKNNAPQIFIFAGKEMIEKIKLSNKQFGFKISFGKRVGVAKITKDFRDRIIRELNERN
jgi:cytoplasmic iron level regulating protein YaaA (DUF328/UPF0246 family)